MKLTSPRVPPLPREAWDDATCHTLRDVRIGSGEMPNIFKTLAHHPELLKRWMVFGNHVLFKSTLPARERELVILRIGWLCEAEYEWAQHVRIGRQCGLDDAEIHAIKLGHSAPLWNARDVLLLKAVDELHREAFITDATYAGLAAHFSTQQLMDLVFAIGQYNLVSMVLKTFGVQLDADLDTGFANT